MITMKPIQMVSALRQGVCNVKFTKVDGEHRDMDCTLNFSRIPSDKVPKTLQEATELSEQSALRVFDVNKGEWRSFRIANVNAFKVKELVETQI
jgi:hypothetical protein